MRTLVVGRSAAETWLTDPAQHLVVQAAAEFLTRDGFAPPDAVLARPQALVQAVQETARLAVANSAPAGVAEELAGTAWRMSVGMKRPGFEFARSQLASLVGLRDAAEIWPVLNNALEGAPDEASRLEVSRLAKSANRLKTLKPYASGATRLAITITDSGVTDWPVPYIAPVVTREPAPINETIVDAMTQVTAVPVAPEEVSALGAAGAVIGEQIAIELGLDPWAIQAAQGGAQTAIQQGMLGGFGSGSGEGGSGWCAVGGAIGFVVAGPPGAAIGCAIGQGVSHTPIGRAAAHGLADAMAWGREQFGEWWVPVGAAVACAVCSAADPAFCVPCILAAEGMEGH